MIVDDWIKFWCRHSVADDVIALRSQLHHILAAKIRDPAKQNWTRGERAVLDAIVRLVTSGGKNPDGGGASSSSSGSGGGWMGGSNQELYGGDEEEEEEEEDFY